MNQPEILQLRGGTKTWATLAFHSDGRVILDHDLTEYAAGGCPGFGLYDAHGQPVRFQPDGAVLCLRWDDGRTRTLAFDRASDQTSLEIADVIDPKGLVRLYLRPIGLGAASVLFV